MPVFRKEIKLTVIEHEGVIYKVFPIPASKILKLYYDYQEMFKSDLKVASLDFYTEVIAILKDHIADWEGVVDESGSPVEFSPDVFESYLRYRAIAYAGIIQLLPKIVSTQGKGQEECWIN